MFLLNINFSIVVRVVLQEERGGVLLQEKHLSISFCLLAFLYCICLRQIKHSPNFSECRIFEVMYIQVQKSSEFTSLLLPTDPPTVSLYVMRRPKKTLIQKTMFSFLSTPLKKKIGDKLTQVYHPKKDISDCFSPFEHLSTLASPSSYKMVHTTRGLYFFKIEILNLNRTSGPCWPPT